MITAKVTCAVKQGQQGSDTKLLTFQPDYGQGRNAEWAAATPYLHLQMTVKSEVAERFEVGQHYTLQFVEDEA